MKNVGRLIASFGYIKAQTSNVNEFRPLCLSCEPREDDENDVTVDTAFGTLYTTPALPQAMKSDMRIYQRSPRDGLIRVQFRPVSYKGWWKDGYRSMPEQCSRT